jgi:hypothetical protein
VTLPSTGKPLGILERINLNPQHFAAVIKAAGISPDQPFNQATQDKAFQAVVVGGALPWHN